MLDDLLDVFKTSQPAAGTILGAIVVFGGIALVLFKGIMERYHSEKSGTVEDAKDLASFVGIAACVGLLAMVVF